MNNDEIVLDSSDSFQPEQCPNPSEFQDLWCNAISNELAEVEEFDPRPPGNWCPSESKRKKVFTQSKWSDYGEYYVEPPVQVPPEYLSAAEAFHWRGKMGVDMRPHVYDPDLKQFLLVDSGSMVTAFPPEPGDNVSEDSFLRAVNGSKIRTYGKKKIVVKIGRKTYDFEAVIADVDTPVLGWDFMRRHRLGVVWNQWGDNVIVDRRAQIYKVLQYKSLPSNRSLKMKNLALVNLGENQNKTRVGIEANDLAFQVASMQNLGDETKEDTSVCYTSGTTICNNFSFNTRGS